MGCMLKKIRKVIEWRIYKSYCIMLVIKGRQELEEPIVLRKADQKLQISLFAKVEYSDMYSEDQ